MSTTTTSPPDYVRFEDDCSGTFSDNWEDKTHPSSSGSASFSGGELLVQDPYTGGNTGYGSNALCKKVWLTAGKWEFNFRVEPHSSQFYTSEAEVCAFYIIKENPTYGSSYYRPELNAGTESYIVFYIGPTNGTNDVVCLRERYNGVANNLCIDSSFDVQSSHNVKVIIDFDNETARLYVDGAQIGSQVSLNASLLADAYPDDKFTVNLHHHVRYQSRLTYWDDFKFYQWGGATTTTTTTTTSTVTSTSTTTTEPP
jgi:hypothetical protein